MNNDITRPLLRYHGGKFLLADWIISHFPKHRVYVESYGGAASVLLKKERSYAEVYNDLDNEVVNVFEQMRSSPQQLLQLLDLTPFSRKEFELSYEPSEDKLEQARRTIVRSFMGFGSASVTQQKTGFRANSNRSGTTPAHDWANYVPALTAIVERIKGVVIENRDALKVMAHQDSLQTLHFVDPPYVKSTRYNGENTECYRYEMANTEHETLCRFLSELKGMVALCGYDTELYNDTLTGWKKATKATFADGAKPRIECLWLNPSIVEARHKETHLPLFPNYKAA